jgi:hypothetical protein
MAPQNPSVLGGPFNYSSQGPQDGDSESVLEIRKIEELQSIRAESLHKTKLDSLTSLYS